MRAKSVDDAIALRGEFVAPTQMLVVADRKNVASFAVGRTPLRRPDSLTRGRTPSLGWRAENDWKGFLRLDALPFSKNPSKGYVAVANDKPKTGVFPRHLGYDWPAKYRHTRLVSLLAKRQYHSPSGFQAMQADVASEMARVVLPLVRVAAMGRSWRASRRSDARRLSCCAVGTVPAKRP